MPTSDHPVGQPARFPTVHGDGVLVKVWAAVSTVDGNVRSVACALYSDGWTIECDTGAGRAWSVPIRERQQRLPRIPDVSDENTYKAALTVIGTVIEHEIDGIEHDGEWVETVPQN